MQAVEGLDLVLASFYHTLYLRTKWYRPSRNLGISWRFARLRSNVAFKYELAVIRSLSIGTIVRNLRIERFKYRTKEPVKIFRIDIHIVESSDEAKQQETNLSKTPFRSTTAAHSLVFLTFVRISRDHLVVCPFVFRLHPVDTMPF